MLNLNWTLAQNSLTVWAKAQIIVCFYYDINAVANDKKNNKSLLLYAIKKLENINFNFKGCNIKYDEYNFRAFEYKVLGNLNSANFEILKLKFNINFLDSVGNSLAQEVYWVVNKDDFILQPNDNIYFNGSQYSDRIYFDNKAKLIKSVRFSLADVELYAAAKQYPEFESTEIKWICKQAEHLNFELNTRKNEVKILDESDRSTQQIAIFELHNIGQKNCRKLDLIIEWFDKNGKAISNKEIQIVDIDAPEFKTNSKLLFPLNETFNEDLWQYPKPFDKFTISIKNAL